MLRDLQRIADRTPLLASALLLLYGVFWALSPLVASEWFIRGLSFDPTALVPIAGWGTVAWRGAALIAALYLTSAALWALPRAWTVATASLPRFSRNGPGPALPRRVAKAGE